MNYGVTLAFTLKNASSDDYEKVYEKLKAVGPPNTVSNENKTIHLPETTVYGKFDGTSAASVRDYISDKATEAFKASQVSGEFFVTVGGMDTTWRHKGF